MLLPTYICFIILRSFLNLNFSEEPIHFNTVQHWLWEPLLHAIIVTLSGTFRVREINNHKLINWWKKTSDKRQSGGRSRSRIINALKCTMLSTPFLSCAIFSLPPAICDNSYASFRRERNYQGEHQGSPLFLRVGNRRNMQVYAAREHTDASS